MKKVALIFTVCIAAFAFGGTSDKDSRSFTVVQQSPAIASVYVKLANGTADKQVIKIWDNVYLHVLPVGHTEIKEGVFGYVVAFARDEAFKQGIMATDQPAHGPREDELLAWYFRNSDNSGPNDLGPKNVNAPGEFRSLDYGSFSVEVRVLEFEMLNAAQGKLPSFQSLSFVVTARRK